ncbi:MAG: hypothetical protein QNK40_09635, partial [Desulfobacterales bacterium]|nr:hypothetical protein [Desulfobacterales bacterium]
LLLLLILQSYSYLLRIQDNKIGNRVLSITMQPRVIAYTFHQGIELSEKNKSPLGRAAVVFNVKICGLSVNIFFV